MKTPVCIISLLISLVSYSQKLTLNKIFASNMVLQQNAEVTLWGNADAGEGVTVITSWDNEKYKTKANDKGRWELSVNTAKAGGPYLISVSTKDTTVTLNNVLLGEVWICAGQSNMEMPLRGFMGQEVTGGNREIALSSGYKNIRIFQSRQAKSDTLQDEPDVWHSWSVVNSKTIKDFSAAGWYFGKFLSDALEGIPIGLIEVVWGGTPAELWISRKTMARFPDIGKDSVLAVSSHYGPLKPSMLFNAMVSPLTKLRFKGVIWYQGESNVKRAGKYEKIFSALITDWREQFGFDFPFYFVQIAPYTYYNQNSAILREAQFRVMKNMEKTGMAVTLDIGQKYRIHPAEKQKVGERLAYWALANDYGFQGLGYTAPEYDHLEVKDSIALVYFKGEIAEATEDELDGCFEVAGENRVFCPARASVGEWKDFAKVYSDKVRHPIAVRYCFRNWCKGKLFGTNELPVSSFRTDDWDE